MTGMSRSARRTDFLAASGRCNPVKTKFQMGLLDWFKNQTRFTRFEDAFALNRPALWDSLKQTVLSPQHTDKSIWLVVHFTETFSQLQMQLENWQIEFDVITSAIDPNQLERAGLLSATGIKIVLADLIPEPYETLLDSNPANTVAMIVLERHPQIMHDHRVEAFARSLPVRVEFGHYLALDDDVVRLVVNEMSIKILTQLGMNEHELITSNMVSRRLSKVLQRLSPTFKTDRPAESAKQWLEING